MTTVSLELPLRMIEPAADELNVGMSWRSHRDEDRLLVDPSAGSVRRLRRRRRARRRRGRRVGCRGSGQPPGARRAARLP